MTSGVLAAVRNRFGFGVMPKVVTNDESSDRPVGVSLRSSEDTGGELTASILRLLWWRVTRLRKTSQG